MSEQYALFGGSSVRLLEQVERAIVGLRREAEILSVALATGRHVLLEGPPGTGKSTLLRVVAEACGVGVEFVEGNAELTPARLLGTYDPALVLQSGYRPEAFLPGSLLNALQAGALLYIEEFNRVPEETLNLLISVLAEGEIHVPRLGRIRASPGFRLVAAMNPFDAIGTARVSQAIADRMCRIALGYQSEEAECRIVQRATGLDAQLVALAVALVRLTREHSQLRVGSSVRGAIDMVQVAHGLARLRAEVVPGRASLLDAALAALSGRIRLEDGCERTPEAIISELLDQLLAKREADPDPSATPPPPPPGGAPARHGGSQGQIVTGTEVRQALRESARRTRSRYELATAHPQLAKVSPEVGQLDQTAFAQALTDEPDQALAMLSDLAGATDPQLRRLARHLAARVFLRMGRIGAARQRGVRRMIATPGAGYGEIDLERSLDRAGGLRPTTREDLVLREWRAPRRAIILLIDQSGSMRGQALATAALAAATTLLAADEHALCGVITFARDALVLQELGHRQPHTALIDDLLNLRGAGTTNIAVALRAAARQLQRAPAAEQVTILLSDCLATAGADPSTALNGIAHLHVLGPSVASEAVSAGRSLARCGNGRYAQVRSLTALPRTLVELLG